LLTCCFALAWPLLKKGPSLHIRCWLLASTLLEIGLFQQETSKKLARS
jgi:hypothetical protein